MNKNHELKNRYLIIEAPEGFDKEDSLSLTDDKKAQTDDKLNAILEFIAKNGECKTIEIAAFLGLKPTQTKSYIYRLISDGKILAKGNNRNRTYSLV